MSTFHHGVTVTEQLTGQQAIRTRSPSVIGLIATADDADATYFPLNVPKLVTKISIARQQWRARIETSLPDTSSGSRAAGRVPPGRGRMRRCLR